MSSLSSRVRLRAWSAWSAWLVAFLFARGALAQPAPPPTPPTTPPPAAPPQTAPPHTGDRWPDNPAVQADPQIDERPRDDAPTSTQGTALVPQDHPVPPPIVLGGEGGDKENEARQTAQIANLQARVASAENRLRRDEEHIRWLRYVHLGAFAQPQLLVQSFNAAASPNATNGVLPPGISANDVIAKSDGTTTNGTYFRMRRTRLRFTFDDDPARLYIEIDPFPIGGVGPGIGTVVRDAEATGIVHWTKDVKTDFGMGVFMVPASLELMERSDTRPFIERAWAIQNVFPAERDIGVHARTTALGDRLLADFGVVNGQNLGEPQFVAEPDLNKSKDGYAQLRYRLGLVSLGVGAYLGRGQIVDAQDLRFKQFSRWWVDYELTAQYRFLQVLGASRLAFDLAVSQNMDTGINYRFGLPAIPATFTDDVKNLDERTLILRFEQELTRWALIGYRYDFYTTDTSIKNNARDTHAFVAVARISRNLRFMNEIDYAIDNMHPTGVAPPNRQIISYSGVLQAGF